MPVAKSYNPNTIVGMTIGMSWQLALVVLLPIFGGHYLDAKLYPKAVPIFTLIGLIIALVGMILVVRTTIKQLNKVTGMNGDTDGDKDAKVGDTTK